MAVARIVRVAGFFALVAGGIGCTDSPNSSQDWGLRDLPGTPPSYEAVLEAASAVIQERYPMSAVSRASGLVLAQTQVEMDGATKTRKTISVRVTRNVTGAYEPEVRVRKLVETASPDIHANPDTGNVSLAKPVGRSTWQAIDYLPYEEQAIHDAIFARLATPKAAPPAGEGADSPADVPAGARA